MGSRRTEERKPNIFQHRNATGEKDSPQSDEKIEARKQEAADCVVAVARWLLYDCKQ